MSLAPHCVLCSTCANSTRVANGREAHCLAGVTLVPNLLACESYVRGPFVPEASGAPRNEPGAPTPF
jgi:hypothetical protein